MAAEQRTYCGRQGHLATISDAAEDLYLELLREQSTWAEAWVGGAQQPGQSAPNAGWLWINNEGPIAGVNGGASFADWTAGEPNDCCLTTDLEDGEENYLAIGRVGLGWNDEGFSGAGGYMVDSEEPIIPIDVKPGDSSNALNRDSQGKIPVAILSTPTFEAASLDPATVRFGRTGTEAAPATHVLTDVNGDGRKDLLCHFNTQDSGFVRGDAVAWLHASPFNGCPMKGSDAIRLVAAAKPVKLTRIDRCPATITVPGAYILSRNLSCPGTAITIAASGVDLDLNGRTLTGNGTGLGVLVEWQENVHIHDGSVQGFEVGVALGGTLDCVLDHLTASQNRLWGIAGRGGSTLLTITRNDASLNGDVGILLDSSSGQVTITDNTANQNGGVGIGVADGAFRNSVTGNTAKGNGRVESRSIPPTAITSAATPPRRMATAGSIS